jgi:hypothetical protein
VPEVALGKLVTLPDGTLIFRSKSVKVGIVDTKGVVQLRDVKVGRDFGIQSEILSGVTESDNVIVNPSDSLTSGTIVRVADADVEKMKRQKLKRRATLPKAKN